MSPEALQLLSAWFSPGFPTGAFAYSHGLETAVADGAVLDRASLVGWIADALVLGAGRDDLILLAAAYADPDGAAACEAARALAASRERLRESEALGAAFVAAASVWAPGLQAAPYPVAVGRAARALDLPLDPLRLLFAQAFAANLVSAGVRLIPLGQIDGQRALAALMPAARAVAAETAGLTLDDLGGAALAWEIAAMRHETLETRLFRT